MVLPATPLHLGPLHPVEQAVTAALAFGPFLVLGVVIVVLRRREARAGAATTDQTADATTGERAAGDRRPGGQRAR